MFKKIALVLALISVSSFFWMTAAVKPIAERRLEEFFEGAEVSIARFSFEFPPAASLHGIQIVSKDYEIRIGKASIGLSRRLTLVSPRARLERIPAGWFEGGGERAKLPVRSVELKDLELELDLGAAGVKGAVRGAAVYDFRTGLSTGRLAADSFSWKAVAVKNAALEAAGPSGTLTASEIKAGKLRVTQVHGTAAAEPSAVKIAPLLADVGGGRAEGELRLDFAGGLNYDGVFRVESVDMEKLTRDFEIERKVTAHGKLDGKIVFSGGRDGLRSLTGRLESGVGGGDLVIRDAALIERLAQNVRQPVEIVEAAFKEYHFDKGALTLSLEEGDVALSANLEGAKGKRDLVIRLHDQP